MKHPPPVRPWPLPPQPISQAWLLDRYAAPTEHEADDVRRRVAWGLSHHEPVEHRELWAARFLWALRAGLLPAGRILAHAGLMPGAGPPGTWISCFVVGVQPGEGFDASLSDIGRTLAAGGGVGVDLSSLPAGSVLPAIDRIDALARALAQRASSLAGRRPALMAALSAEHPDAGGFVAAKSLDPNRWPHLNLSLAVGDRFMAAAEASPLWQRLVHAAWASGEPGLLFIDRIRSEDNLGHLERIAAANPCGEQPLPVNGACCLASIDLTRFVSAPFTPQARTDWAGLREVARLGVRLLDNVLDLTPWPLPAQQRQMQRARRIGLGVTGLVDALILLGLPPDSANARHWAARAMCLVRDAAYGASARLAAERGSTPVARPGLVEALLAPPHAASRLPAALQGLIRRYGLRHTHLLAIAPAASISVAMADGVSSGIEPPLAPRVRRSWRDRHGQLHHDGVEDAAARLWRLRPPDGAGAAAGPSRDGASTGSLPPAWRSAADLTPEAVVGLQAAVAPLVDAGISKTVALPAEAGPEGVNHLLRQAWQRGLKGVTVFRAGTRPAVVAPEPASLPTPREDGPSREPPGSRESGRAAAASRGPVP